MSSEPFAGEPEYVRRALEVSIHIGLIILLVAACLLILRPFLPLVVWGIIIAISVYPGYGKLRRALGGRGSLAAVVCTVAMLAAVIVPAMLLTGTIVQGVHTLAANLKEGKLPIPPPPPKVETWFLIGPPLQALWSGASTSLSSVLGKLIPHVKGVIPVLLSASAKIGLTVLQFVLSILVAGVLLARAKGGAAAAESLAKRLFGAKASEFEELAGSTIRSVTTGILGVALIQSILAAVGFLVVGLPAAGLWAVIFLFAAVLQVGTVVLIPAVIYVLATASMAKAVVFLIWCAFVGLMDNVLKPLLLGRGVDVPIVVIFLGAIGGFLAMGIIGLFIGAIILSVGYKLFLAWLADDPATIGE
jgi:predicted PurR-regulated permease PerM